MTLHPANLDLHTNPYCDCHESWAYDPVHFGRRNGNLTLPSAPSTRSRYGLIPVGATRWPQVKVDKLSSPSRPSLRAFQLGLHLSPNVLSITYSAKFFWPSEDIDSKLVRSFENKTVK